MMKKDQFSNAIDLAFSKRDSATWVKTSKRLIDYFYGRYNQGASTKTRYVVNTCFSLVNLILPNFIINQPYIRTKPRNTKYFREVEGEMQAEGMEMINNVKAAMTGEAVVNAHYGKNKIAFENRKAIQDALFYPFGIVKNGVSFDEEGGKVKNDEPYLKRVNPMDFGWHPMATTCDDAEWLIHRNVMNKEKAKSMFGNKVEDLANEIPEHVRKRLKDDGQASELSNLVTIYEVHAQEKGKIYYYGGENKHLLDEKDNGLWFNGSHFDMIKFSSDNDKFLGIPMLQMVEDQMVALNEIFTMMYEHLKKFPGMVFIDQDAVDDDMLKRMENSETASIHVVRKSDKIKFTQPLTMGADYYNSFRVVKDIIYDVLGIPDFTTMAGTHRKSASEASFIQGDATVRRNYFLNIVKEFVLSGIEKQFSLKQQFMDEKEVIKASGELMYQTFVASKEDIQGEFQFDFDVDSMAATNVAELQNLTQLLQIQAQNEILHPTLKAMNPSKLARYLYKKGGVNIDMFLNGEIEEAVSLNPEKENEIAEKGDIMPNPKKGEDHEYHAKIHRDFLKERIQKLGAENAQGDPVVQRVIEHLAVTEMLRDEADMKPEKPKPTQPTQGAAPEMMTQPEVMEPDGPLQ